MALPPAPTRPNTAAPVDVCGNVINTTTPDLLPESLISFKAHIKTSKGVGSYGRQVDQMKLNCGHNIGAEDLGEATNFAYYQGDMSVACPVEPKKCGKPISYQEIFAALVLPSNVQKNFDELMFELYMSKAGSKCKKCNTNCARDDPTEIRLRCGTCTKSTNKVYDFCHCCGQEWKSGGKIYCGNSNCDNSKDLLAVLAASKLEPLHGKQVPRLRACPNCGHLVSLSSGCQHVVTGCPKAEGGCGHFFCMSCLQTRVDRCTYNVATCTPANRCRAATCGWCPFNCAVAPAQTSIPKKK